MLWAAVQLVAGTVKAAYGHGCVLMDHTTGLKGVKRPLDESSAERENAGAGARHDATRPRENGKTKRQRVDAGDDGSSAAVVKPAAAATAAAAAVSVPSAAAASVERAPPRAAPKSSPPPAYPFFAKSGVGYSLVPPPPRPRRRARSTSVLAEA